MTLSLEHVRKVVGGDTHLYDLSLSVEPGSFNVLLGLTGAGKTSVMRLMAGLDRPSSGRIVMNGRDVTRVPVRKRNVAMVYQEFINYPAFTCFDNIASPLKLARLGRQEIRERVHREAERLHIEHLLERMPGELSGGQQQRLAMARALVRDADLLLMDEPLVNLDYKLREELREEMREIFRERDAIVVYATTDPMEALTLGGNTAVLHEGELIQYGATPYVYHHPASVAVTQVFSDPPMNLFEARVDDGLVRVGDNEPVERPAHFAQLAPGRYRVGVRPSHVTVAPRTDADLVVRGDVDIAEITGSETFIHMRRGEAEWVVQASGAHPFELGQTLSVHVDPRHLFAFDDDGRLMASPTRRRVDA
ncbi:sn-glycerol-3-phosphate import ATP-binding protein UgpC [wastewater metagenome]|uniref:sn-glycerol-3-phosphate import ATP-binding protein UgpC n=2 Tax=unclassified sequences TaxID=12908 RepID=A0A5B8RE14_9ZZZZ|nr:MULTISPECIES: ABC transporter ATP-binding protein [Arhodomonas]QEA07269.1 sn-glycerol-3-phosphate import ATP-binding protein UgpC [uncultured organism]